MSYETAAKASFEHKPVMLDQVVQYLNIKPNGTYVDCTYGRGGHTRAILSHLGVNGQLVLLDCDPEAIDDAQNQLGNDSRVHICHSPFGELKKVLRSLNIDEVDGIFADLGVSSPQIDKAERGFSFIHSGPVDMRMNPETGSSVAQWLRTASATDIAQVLKQYGEERKAFAIAKAIVANPQCLESTVLLSQLIAKVLANSNEKKHPATRTFQALRIFINDEINQLQQLLQQGCNLLKVGGNWVLLSFHSLEDRLVKHFFRQLVQPPTAPSYIPIIEQQPAFKWQLTAKGITAYPNEVATNPRARSAKLRAIVKLAQ